MSKFEYEEGDEFDLSPQEASVKALEILAAGGTYSINGNILKITSLPSKKAEEPKVEVKEEEKPKAAPAHKPTASKAEKGGGS